jgi:hypothetical protein
MGHLAVELIGHHFLSSGYSKDGPRFGCAAAALVCCHQTLYPVSEVLCLCGAGSETDKQISYSLSQMLLGVKDVYELAVLRTSDDHDIGVLGTEDST